MYDWIVLYCYIVYIHTLQQIHLELYFSLDTADFITSAMMNYQNL